MQKRNEGRNSKYMNILILGNGFDIAHGLKTRYKDFLEYCVKNKMEDKQYYLNIWLQHFINRQHDMGDTWIDLETEIYNVIVNLVLNKALFDFFKTGTYRFELEKSNRSFRFENISNYLKTYSKKKLNNEHFQVLQEEGTYKGNLNVYIENEDGLANFLYEQLRIFTKLFEEYLLEIVNPQNSMYKLSLQSIGAKEGDNGVYVLSFNYTDTCEKFYTKKFKQYSNIEKFTPIYVHGNAIHNSDYKKCQLVLGTHSFNSPEYKDTKYDIPVCFNIFQKHNQRHKYGTIESYQNLIRELLVLKENNKSNFPNFHVIGHSLDRTDHSILKHIFNINKMATINIYYHDELSQKKLIDNITNIIGEDDVMSRVRFIHQHNEKRSILKYLKEPDYSPLLTI